MPKRPSTVIDSTVKLKYLGPATTTKRPVVAGHRNRTERKGGIIQTDIRQKLSTESMDVGIKLP